MDIKKSLRIMENLGDRKMKFSYEELDSYDRKRLYRIIEAYLEI